MLSRPPDADKGEEDNTDVMLIPPEAFIRSLETSDPTEENMSPTHGTRLKADFVRCL